MAAVFELNIMTPEREFFSGTVQALVVTAPDGELCIEAGHLPLVAPIVVGSISIKANGKWRRAFTSEGFIEVLHEGVVLFTQACEWPEDIDVRRAEESAHRAQERLRQKRSMAEYKASKISLARAMARLRLTNHDINNSH